LVAVLVKQQRRTVAYIRVSTEEQATEGYSLADQVQQCKHYAMAKKWVSSLDDVEVYADPGVSGTKEHRPGLDRLMTDVKDGQIERVIITQLDRLGRLASLILSLDDEMADYDVQRVYIKEGIDTTTDVGRLMRTILAAVAEFERDSMVGRTSGGRRQKAVNGEVWIPRYGYSLLPSHPWYRLDPSTAPVVKRIFEDVASGTSTGKLAVQLTAEKIPAPRGGSTWQYTTVGKIVKNAVYYGKHEYGKTTNKTINGKRVIRQNKPENIIAQDVPPIVSKRLWDLANERLSSNRITSKRNNKHNDLLRGLLYCGALQEDGTICNRKMQGEGKGNYRQYRCRYTASTGEQKHHNVNGHDVDAAVWQTVQARLLNPSLVTKGLSENKVVIFPLRLGVE